MTPSATSLPQAIAKATHAPVIDAVRVPPSAWITSQSSRTVFSPSAFMSTTARMLRPISRWISIVRPPTLPRAASRSVRVSVEPGSMPYSAVTQPRPSPFIQRGTSCSTDAVQITFVRPISISTEPAGCSMKSGVMHTGRRSVGPRPSILVVIR